MKKTIIFTLLCMAMALPAVAQPGRLYGRPAQPRVQTVSRHGNEYMGWHRYYFGLRVGLNASHVSSESPALDGSGIKSGLNIGLAAGTQLTYHAPLFFETGLYYTEKGGKGDHDFKYSLNYLEMPFVLKYIHNFDRSFSIQPFFGGYVAAGVSGKVKNYYARESYNAFGGDYDQFKRFDGGLRLGVGVQYEMLYADVTYDLGLSNVGHDVFDEAKNSALMLNFGINF